MRRTATSWSTVSISSSTSRPGPIRPGSGLDPLMKREVRGCVAEARQRGQTVFLSSHQLAEVEAVCDQVAILRAGRLVEVDSIADLRRLRRTVVEVSYRGVQPSLE